ncbi:hypothetical protein U3516DRAFT_887457 [Neocallimastix sp. 'constans']
MVAIIYLNYRIIITTLRFIIIMNGIIIFSCFRTYYINGVCIYITSRYNTYISFILVTL